MPGQTRGAGASLRCILQGENIHALKSVGRFFSERAEKLKLYLQSAMGTRRPGSSSTREENPTEK